MDKQAQDRCHRIGQEKTVHIYRLISMNTIEENIFKKSLQKRELGGMIIEGNFNTDHFKKVNYKEVLEESLTPFRPKKLDIMKEENIVFSSGLEGERDLGLEEAERRKYEEVLFKVEDQEDVEAYQDAKREIDDEFDEEQQEKEAKVEEVKVKEVKEEGQDQASKQLTGVKRYEMIDWEQNEGLNRVTKLAIKVTKARYTFDQYMQDKSEKDANFIDPEEEFKIQKEREEKEKEEEDESMSSEISSDRDNYDAEQAFDLYKIAQEEIPISLVKNQDDE